MSLYLLNLRFILRRQSYKFKKAIISSALVATVAVAATSIAVPLVLKSDQQSGQVNTSCWQFG